MKCVFRCLIIVLSLSSSEATFAQGTPPFGWPPLGDAGIGGGTGGTGGTTPINGWRTKTIVQKASRTLTVSRGTYAWEGLSTTDLAGTRELSWEDSQYSDNTSRGELEYNADKLGSRAYSRIEAEVNDAWDYGDTTLTLTTTTDFESQAELYWDGDEYQPVQPTDATLSAGVSVKLHADGTVTGDTSSPATSTSSAKITASWTAGAPFNYNFKFQNVGITGRASSSPTVSSYLNWIGFVKFPAGWGAVVDFSQNLDDNQSDNVYSHDIVYNASETPIKRQISGGVGYTWKGTAVASGTAYSNGATAVANAKADVSASMSISPFKAVAQPE